VCVCFLADTAHGADTAHDADAQSTSLDAGVCYAHCLIWLVTELKLCFKDAAWQRMGSWELCLGVTRGGSLLSAFVCSLQPVWTSYRLCLVKALPAGCNGAVLHAWGLARTWSRVVLIISYELYSQCLCKYYLLFIITNHRQVVETESGLEGLLEAVQAALLQECCQTCRPGASISCCVEGCDLSMYLPYTTLPCNSKSGSPAKLVPFDAWQCMTIFHQACSSLHLSLAGA